MTRYLIMGPVLPMDQEPWDPMLPTQPALYTKIRPVTTLQARSSVQAPELPKNPEI